MPYIQPNPFYVTEKIIKPYECAMIVVEGPNLKGKLNLDGLEIKYQNFSIAQLTLNPEAKDQPMLYGFLGTDITFLMIKVKYIPLDPNWAIEEEQYIEYYFEDDPTTIRQIGQLLILTGNSQKRIPQIYLNNPSTKNNVYLDVLMANLEQSSLTNVNQYSQNSYFSGLYYNSIISDLVNYTMPTSNGSIELKILDPTDKAIMVIPYVNIRTITKLDAFTLILGLDTEEKVKLEFLSEYNTDQANSRINWVLRSPRWRFLTKTSPPLDITPPVYTWNTLETGYTYSIGTGETMVYFPNTTGTTFTQNDLKRMFVQSITDSMDGPMYNSSVAIFFANDMSPLTGITEGGIYDLYFSAKDLAGNETTEQKYLYVSNVAPTIIFKPGYTGTGFTMALNNYARTGITDTDIRNLTVDSVYDPVDKDLTIYDIVIASNGYTGFTISQTGVSWITYTLTNVAGLSGQTGKELKSVLPEIVFKNIFYSGTTTGLTYGTFDISLSTDTVHLGSITQSDIIRKTIYSIIDELDPTISSDNITITGVSFYVTMEGYYNITYTIVDVYGVHNVYQRIMHVIS